MVKIVRSLLLLSVIVSAFVAAGCSSEPTYAPGESPKEQAMKIKPGAGGGGAPAAAAPGAAAPGAGAGAGGAAGRPGMAGASAGAVN